MKGVAFGLCHEGMEYPAQIYAAVQAAQGCLRWIPFNRLACVFVFLSFLKISKPETSRAGNCMPLMFRVPEDLAGVFVHPCTTCSDGNRHEWHNGDPPLHAL